VQNSILRLPTLNLATGASLVPVGYGSFSTSNNHSYAGAMGFPGALMYHHHHHHHHHSNNNHQSSQDCLLLPSKNQPLKGNNSNINRNSKNSIENHKSPWYDPIRYDNIIGNRLTKPEVDDKESDVIIFDEDEVSTRSNDRNFKIFIMGHRNETTKPISNAKASTTNTKALVLPLCQYHHSDCPNMIQWIPKHIFTGPFESNQQVDGCDGQIISTFMIAPTVMVFIYFN
jgi:hypothetical protein